MPSTHELLILAIAIVAIWLALKVAKLVIRVILFVITLVIAGAVLWFVFVR